MKKLLCFLTISLFIFIGQNVSAQGGMSGGPNGMTCDANPACDPTSGTCCNQCDPNPACVAGDPNAIPCCGGPGGMPGGPGPMDGGPNDHGGPNDQHMSGSNDHGGPNDGMNRGPNDHGGPGPNDHGDPCMNMPPGPAQAECYKHKNDHRGPNDGMNRGPNDHMRDPGCDPNLAPDAGGCPDGFQGRPGGPGPNGDMNGGPGNHPPVDISHCANMPPDSRPGCEEAAHRAAGGPGNHPPLDCPPGSRNPLCAPGGPNDHRGPNGDMNGGPGRMPPMGDKNGQ